MVPLEVRPAHWFWLFAGLGLVVLAWAGTLDTLSGDYVSASLLDAGIIYGTARGINALVSALQGTELDMWLVTFSIGELLDPVNDVIERFSAVMTVAIASLVIQQLLLVIVAHTSFTAALTVAGILVLVVYWAGKTRGLRSLARVFLVLAFLRFSLALVVLANLWVDSVFLPNSASPEHSVMEEFYRDLDNVSDAVRGQGKRSEVTGQFERLQDKFDAFVDGTLALLGAMLLKSLILPVLFLLALMRLWRQLIDLEL